MNGRQWESGTPSFTFISLMACVLLLDDDDDLRAGLAGVLEVAGYRVLQASEGRAALRFFETDRPDIVVTDIVMDGMEGIATIMAIRTARERLPVVAISGNPLYLKNSRALGADATLLKPFRATTLLDTINGLLGETV